MVLAYYFTKPLMNLRLRELNNMIIGYKSIFDFEPSILHSIKERVGKPPKQNQKFVIGRPYLSKREKYKTCDM